MATTINQERVVVFSDLHSPLTDWKYLGHALDWAKDNRITTCILAGDVTNADSVSDYAPKQSNAGLTHDVNTTRECVADICEWFKQTYYIKGNHDYRFVKKLGYTGSFVEVMSDVLQFKGKNLTILNDDHIWIENAAGRTYVCHPTTYSRIPLSNCKAIQAKTNSHVIAGHCHHSAMGYAPDGKHVLIEAGGFFDMENTEYINSTSTFPRWVNGFSAIVDGKFRLLTKQGEVS